MSDLCLVQMHGEPGSGKTTLARAIAAELRAVMLELDVTTDALQRSGLQLLPPGEPAYAVHYSLAQHLLEQGCSVVLDNPVFRKFVEVRSLEVASRAGAAWVMIECVCPDAPELRRRLGARKAMEHQTRDVVDWRSLSGTSEPESDRLVLDTRIDTASSVKRAVAYIRSR